MELNDINHITVAEDCQYKTCTKCKVNQPLYSYRKKAASKDGHATICKACNVQYQAEYQNKNKEALSVRKSEEYRRNRIRYLTYAKQYRENPENNIKERKSAEYQRNKHNPSRAANRRAYAIRSRDRENQRKRERARTDPLYRLQRTARSLVKASIKRGGFTKTSTTAKIVGCSFIELLEHLGPKPCEDAHLDHICPIAQAKTEEELIKLNHYSNLQWLPSAENKAKADKYTLLGDYMCRMLLGRPFVL